MAKAQTYSELLEKQQGNWELTLKQYQQKQHTQTVQIEEYAEPIVAQKQRMTDIEKTLELLQVRHAQLQVETEMQEQVFKEASSAVQVAQQSLHQAELELQKVQNIGQLEQTKQQAQFGLH